MQCATCGASHALGEAWTSLRVQALCGSCNYNMEGCAGLWMKCRCKPFLEKEQAWT